MNLLFAIPAAAARCPAASTSPTRSAPRIDIPGVLTVTAGLFGLVFGFSNAETHGWGEPLTIVSLAAGVVLLVASSSSSSRVAHPLLPLRVVLDRDRGGSYLAIGISGAGMFGVFLFLTYYLQQTLGFSPIQTGLGFLPMSRGDHGHRDDGDDEARAALRRRARSSTLGMALAAIAMALLAQLDVDSSYAAHVLPALLVMGVGLGLIFAPAMSTATLGVEPTRRRRRLGDGQHEPAGRRLDRHRGAEHDLHERGDELRDEPAPAARRCRAGRDARLHDGVLVLGGDLRRRRGRLRCAAAQRRRGRPAGRVGEPVLAH